MKSTRIAALLTVVLILSITGTANAETRERYLLCTKNSITATTTYDLLVDRSVNRADLVIAETADITVTCSGEWEIKLGVISETDATNGTAHFFWVQQFHPASKTLYEVDFSGPIAATVIQDSTTYSALGFATNDWKTANEFQNDAGDLTPVNSTGSVTTASWAHGDIVLVVEEITDGGDLDLSCRFKYTESRAGSF